MAIVIKPPSPLPAGFSVFLAGSIEMGSAGNWQALMEQQLADTEMILLNPRRDGWDSLWAQSRENPQFREQVEWELNAMEKANLIVMYFEPSTRSPVSMLELGLFARSRKLVVCCPDGFWRKGNIDIVCDKYRIQQVDSLNGLVDHIRRVAGERSC